MGKRGKPYSPEFKEEAVRLVHSSEEKHPVAKIARELDVSTETLRNKWVKQAQIDASGSSYVWVECMNDWIQRRR
jgi:transposase-like protein